MSDGPTDETPTRDAGLPALPPADPAPAAQPDGGRIGPIVPDEALDRVTPYQAAGHVSPWGYIFLLGVAGLLTGWAWYRVEDNTSVVTQAWIFVAALLTLAPIAWHSVDFFQSVTTRRGGAFLAVVVTVTLGCAVMGFVSAINVVYRERLPVADLTESGRYTLGDETRKILAKIPEGGIVYATYLQRPSGNPYLRESAVEQLRVYAFQTPQVVVREFEDYREKEAAKEYLAKVGVESTAGSDEQDVIVLSWAEPNREVARGKQKEIVVQGSSFTSRSPLDGRETWLGERVITSAIQELVFTRLKAYATGGHGERSLAADLRGVRERLTGQNIEVVDRTLDLASSSTVPEDCDLLLVLGPESEFKVEETAAIRAWLEKGRSLLLTLDVEPTGKRRTTGLEPLLDTFGISPRINYIVLSPRLERTSAGVLVSMVTEFPAASRDYSSHAAVEALRRGSGFSTWFSQSSFLEVETEPKAGLTVEPVVWAPDPGMKDAPRPFAARITPGRKDYRTPDETTDVLNRRLPLVVAAKKDLAADAPAGRKDARVVVSGDTDAFSDMVTRQNAPNLDLFGGLVQWGLRREDLVAVSEKTLEQERANIEDKDHRMAFWWPLVTALGALLAGAAVWWTRRR